MASNTTPLQPVNQVAGKRPKKMIVIDHPLHPGIDRREIVHGEIVHGPKTDSFTPPMLINQKNCVNVSF